MPRTDRLFETFTRKKLVDKYDPGTTLPRVLNVLDLTLLGIGNTLGVGIYVLAGAEAKRDAGPAVLISFFVAALASLLAGLCYAEFGARVPKAGSAYVYSYVCVGELVAFIVGWNLILENVIGLASVAKGYSENVDQMLDHVMSSFFRENFPLGMANLVSDHFDWFAFSITLGLTVVVAFGAKDMHMCNAIFTVINISVIIFVVIAGSYYADPKNWFLDKAVASAKYPNVSSSDIGQGGFAPFGFHVPQLSINVGIMKGAATCFYGFIGFDRIATTGENAKNPQKDIPKAIILALLLIFLLYFSTSTVITMMAPYFLQDETASLAHAFSFGGYGAGKWIVSIGALCGIFTSILGCIFSLPRIIYAMASDGVLFKFLSKIHPRFETPVVALLIAGGFGALFAAILDLHHLINMVCIGTLIAYTLVAVCVLCLRYRRDTEGADDNKRLDIEQMDIMYAKQTLWKKIFNYCDIPVPTPATSKFTDQAIILFCVCTLIFCNIAAHFEELLFDLNPLVLMPWGFFALVLIDIMISLSFQPVSKAKLAFKVPLVPLLPGLSIVLNTYLIMKLSWLTWLQFFVWMGLGLGMYAACLLNGTTDKAYLENQEKVERNLRRVPIHQGSSAVVQEESAK